MGRYSAETFARPCFGNVLKIVLRQSRGTCGDCVKPVKDSKTRSRKSSEAKCSNSATSSFSSADLLAFNRLIAINNSSLCQSFSESTGAVAITSSGLPAKICSNIFASSFASGCSGTCRTTVAWSRDISFHFPEFLNNASNSDDFHARNSCRCNVRSCNDNLRSSPQSCAKHLCNLSPWSSFDARNAKKIREHLPPRVAALNKICSSSLKGALEVESLRCISWWYLAGRPSSSKVGSQFFCL